MNRERALPVEPESGRRPPREQWLLGTVTVVFNSPAAVGSGVAAGEIADALMHVEDVANVFVRRLGRPSSCRVDVRARRPDEAVEAALRPIEIVCNQLGLTREVMSVIIEREDEGVPLTGRVAVLRRDRDAIA